MVLVLFFLGTILLLSVLTFLILLSTLRIDIRKLNIITDANRENKLKKDILMYVGIYLMGRWKLLEIKIDNEKLKKINVKEKIKKIDIQKLKQEKLIDIDSLKQFKKLPIDVEKFNLNLSLGTIDLNLTTVINFIIILIVSMILPRIIVKYYAEKHASFLKFEISFIFLTDKSVILHKSMKKVRC